eukprot:jgi/Chrpa1/4309/Chrysochromulina_OHIO_Genome00001893-RA
MPTADVGDIFRVVAISVSKLVVSGGLSAWVFRQLEHQKKIKNPDSVLKDLAVVNTNLLIPLFIFTRCSMGLTADLVMQLWVVPLLTLAFMSVGYLSGVAATRLSAAPRAMWPTMVTMVTFSNVVGMPLPLLESLISGLFGQQAAEAQVRGASFLFLCNVAQSVTMWSLAGPMLRHGGPFARPHEDGSQSGIILESSTRSDQPPPDEGVGRGRRPKIVWRAPKHSRLTTVEHGAMQPSDEDPSVGAKLEAAMDAEEVQSAARPPRTPSTLWGRIRASPFIDGMLAVRNAINRPAAASLMGILVGCTPLRYVFVEEAAPMRWLIDSLELLGTGGIPLIIFVLGATLSKGGGNGGSVGDMPRAAVVATLLAKLVLVPVLNICLIYACTYAGVLTRGIDGLLPLTMVIVGASPTAMNISMIATMQGTGHREVAMLMFYQYVLAIVTVSLFASVGLLLFLT